MLKGGVIMDVTTPEEARIAEEAGAVAVMALERVPADIRKEGGVARMSDAEVIHAIKQAVTIPVMAKARIGHFVEAQILEALEVDYIDESEVHLHLCQLTSFDPVLDPCLVLCVWLGFLLPLCKLKNTCKPVLKTTCALQVLTPADDCHHINKHNFKIPFVCGCRDLGEALRRVSEGAAMIRTKVCICTSVTCLQQADSIPVPSEMSDHVLGVFPSRAVGAGCLHGALCLAGIYLVSLCPHAGRGRHRECR